MDKKKNLLVIGIVIGLIVLFVAAGADISKNNATKKKIFTKQAPWYAVHLSNGHVYFGHLLSVTSDIIALGNTYYLEVYAAQPQQAATSTNFQVQQTPQQIYNLARRGNGSSMATDNTLFINKSAVLFWEKLSPESDMAKSLAKTETAKK